MEGVCILNAGVCLIGRDGRQCVQFANDAVHIADSEECLQRMVNEMEVVCGRRKLMVYVDKGKAKKVYKSGKY